MLSLNLDDTDTQLRLNPRMPERERLAFQQMLKQANPPDRLVWVTSSGSSGCPKLVGLSRSAIFASAIAVNTHLNSTCADRWLLALPTFHVGGMGIIARAQLTGAAVVSLSNGWSAREFLAVADRQAVTLSALVPTQLFDLVKLAKQAPASIRAIIIGGDALAPDLYFRARALGYPVLPSYGLSECCSQVATASLQSLSETEMPRPTILEHVKCQTGPNQELAIHSPSLLTGYITRNNQHAQFFDPKVNGWFETTDRVRIADHQLEVLGRLSNVVKVSGEQVDLTKLSNIFRKIAPQQDAIVFAIPDDRTGHRVVLVSLSAVDESRLNLLREQFNREVMPFERIQEIRIVEQFPRTALGKLATEELRNLLG